MPRKTMQLQWPQGVVRRGPVRPNPDVWTSPWAINTRLEDSLTSRLRGGSFTGQAASTLGEPRYVYVTTENEDHVLTENGDPIVLGPQYGVATGWERKWVPPAEYGLLLEVGDELLDEDGDPIVLEYGVETGYERKWVATGDDAPTSGPADCLYRDRVFRVSDAIILTSRQGDYTTWDYGGELEDTGRAMVFQLAEAGEIGNDVAALVPHKDSYLLGFTATETWVLRGDPATGSLQNVSRHVGIIGPRAWCKSHDTVYFLSSQGLYSVGVDGSGLKPVSEDRIPEHLTGVDDEDCVLDYYHPDGGVYIHLTTAPSWFYDTAREQFWPFDTTETDSHVLLGPFQLGEGDKHGRALNLHGNVAAGSDDVTWRLVLGDTAEDAAANGKAAITLALAAGDYSAYVASSGTWSAGRAHMAYPRNRAIWCVLWLHSTGDWAWETATLTATVSGNWR